MTLQARVRRLQDTLSTIGVGVIALGAWPLVKMTLLFFLYNEETQRELFDIRDEISMQLYYAIFAVIAIIALLIHVYVGLSARAEGFGKRKGYLYLIIAALMIVASVASIVLIVLGMSTVYSTFDLLMSVVMEITLIAVLVLMIFCAIRLRRLNELTE